MLTPEQQAKAAALKAQREARSQRFRERARQRGRSVSSAGPPRTAIGPQGCAIDPIAQGRHPANSSPLKVAGCRCLSAGGGFPQNPPRPSLERAACICRRAFARRTKAPDSVLAIRRAALGAQRRPHADGGVRWFRFRRADVRGPLDRDYPDAAVANLAGPRRRRDGLDGGIDQVARDDGLDLHLGQEVQVGTPCRDTSRCGPAAVRARGPR